MPLSEREQRILDQIEHDLTAQMSSRTRRRARIPGWRLRRRRPLVGLLGVVAGLAMMLTAAVTAQMWLAAAGFMTMTVAGAYGLPTGHHHQVAAQSVPTGRHR